MKYIRTGKRPFNISEDRAMLGKRFKVMCADAGLSLHDTAKILHVTPRTVYAWFSGRTSVPYAAYKLVRILGRYELPGDAFKGWMIHSGKLWTPEGVWFKPEDSAWWSLLCRQAQCFRAMYQRAGDFERQLMQLAAVGQYDLGRAVLPGAEAAKAETPEPGKLATHGGGGAAAANLFLVHFRPQEGQKAPVSLEKPPRRQTPPNCNKTVSGH